MNTTLNYTPETVTAIEILENLTSSKRKYILEQLRKLISEEEIEEKWDKLLELSPEPMVQMAKKAIQEHKAGKSKPMKL